MPITKHFLKSFEQFTTNYKVTGASSSYISWGKEQNHGAICGYFGELLNLITSNQEVFHDASIIEYLAVPINLSANTNRYLHECWNKFLIEYNSVAKMYAPIHTMDSSTPTHIQIALEGNSSERMMRDLKSALESTQKAQEFSRKAYLSEVELLKKQLEELTRENTQLSAENRLLKEQVRKDEMFRSLQPQIATAQHQLASFADLLNNLYEMTGGRSTLSSPSLITVSSLEKEKREVPVPDKIATSVSSSTTGDRLTTTDSPSPPPKLTPVLHVPVSTNTHAAPEKDIPSPLLITSEQGEDSIIKSTIPPKTPSKVSTAQQQEPKPTLSGEGFFNELSKELAKRKANKEASSSTAPIQKKNM